MDYNKGSLKGCPPGERPPLLICVFIFILFFSTSAYAAEKQWGGAGDGVSWEDPSNWSPTAVPTVSDDAIVATANAAVIASETFNAKSITVGGRGAANFTVNDFVYGTVTPANNTDTALLIRKDGLVTLQGAGDITLKGAFKKTEETLTNEPAFMFEAS